MWHDARHVYLSGKLDLTLFFNESTGFAKEERHIVVPEEGIIGWRFVGWGLFLSQLLGLVQDVLQELIPINWGFGGCGHGGGVFQVVVGEV